MDGRNHRNAGSQARPHHLVSNLDRFILVGCGNHDNNYMDRFSLHRTARILKRIFTINLIISTARPDLIQV